MLRLARLARFGSKSIFRLCWNKIQVKSNFSVTEKSSTYLQFSVFLVYVSPDTLLREHILLSKNHIMYFISIVSAVAWKRFLELLLCFILNYVSKNFFQNPWEKVLEVYDFCNNSNFPWFSPRYLIICM